jgi:RHS repeat-associated protein
VQYAGLGQESQTTYDRLNRPTSVRHLVDSSTETYFYDLFGDLKTSTSSAPGTTTLRYTFGYDALHRLQSKTDGRGDRVLYYDRDTAGNILYKTTFQGSTTTYTYDSAGRVISAFNPDYLTVNYQYDPAGRLLSRLMSSGAKSVYAYDFGGWLQSIQHFDAVGALSRSSIFVRDNLGQIKRITDGAGNITNYTLDGLNRLVTVDAPGSANDESFSYDRVGNRLTHTRGGLTRWYTYTTATQRAVPVGAGSYTPTYNDRLQTVRLGSAAGTVESGFSYDDEGRLLAQTGVRAKTLAWDQQGRVKTLRVGLGLTESYSYDNSSWRIGRSGGNLGTLSYYLEGEHLESVESGGQLQEKYFRGVSTDELVAGYRWTTRANGVGYFEPAMYQHDQVTSVTGTTAPNGGGTSSLSYWAFGEPQASSGTLQSRLKYTGREDDGTGLYYYRRRYYDPAIGRFISEDPLRFGGGENFYAYAGNDPINANDPMGTYAEVAVNGSNVSIVIPIRYTGVGFAQVPNAAQRFNNDIANRWSGQFGPYNVTTTVKELGFFGSLFTSSSRQNSIEITSAPRSSPGFTATVSCMSGGGCSGQWPALMSAFPGVGAHEAGHILRLDDNNRIVGGRSVALPGYEGNIMGTITGQPTADQITSIVNTANGGWQHVGKPPQHFSVDAVGGGGASGGFLLYPNKPNNNSSTSVYSKP